MPICPQRGCGCSYTSETLSIYPDESNINLIHFEVADPSVITDLRDDVDQAQIDIASLLPLLGAYTTDTVTAGTGITSVAMRLIRIPTSTAYSLVVCVTAGFVNSTGGALANNYTVVTVPSGYRPPTNRRISGFNASAGVNTLSYALTTAGSLNIQVGGGWTAPANLASFGAYPSVWETTDAAP